ncbi:putative alkaloid synthase/Surface mucin Hemomucin [Heracleum sosnowskyi]|uniref:Alkaloid synthase/Surface mucin Hemomucin n=1 Tax=Heracleum sosnowskyi TaxID=360622 RepID=A0AAD8IMW6_9APIA|nr:putative alkaloid synthase/Surface mucin Hemomucin [Heracleum sosnowskyi]
MALAIGKSQYKFIVSSLWLVLCVSITGYHLVSADELAYFAKLNLPRGATGPDSLAFNQKGDEFYTGVSNGRILKYELENHAFVNFATTSPLRNNANSDDRNETKLGQVPCRPLGVAINYNNDDLYITDAICGLAVVGSNGGVATTIANSANGTPFLFLDSIDIDPQTQTVYFTDAGTIFQKTLNVAEILSSGDTSGKLLKYDPGTKQITVLLTELSGATGVAVSADGAFVLVSEYIARQIRRYWIRGPLAGTSDIFIQLAGSPDNIKRTMFGDFWVAVSMIDLQLPVPSLVPFGQRINPIGIILENFSLEVQYRNAIVSEVQENAWGIFVGTLLGSFVGIYRR